MAANITTNWTPTRLEQFEQLYSKGLSFRLIGDEIGVTRSAVAGKTRRMQQASLLPPRGKKPLLAAVQKRGTPRPKKPIHHRPLPAPPSQIPRKLPPPRIVPGVDYSKRIDELDDTSCRYPLWRERAPHNERFYCGAPCVGLSFGMPYCKFHTRVCGGSG